MFRFFEKELKLQTTERSVAKMVVLATALAALTSVSPAQGQSSTTACSTNTFGTTTCQTDENNNRPNDYSIESPTNALQESHKFWTAVSDKERTEQERQQKIKRQENLQADLDILIKSNPTAKDFANFILKYPEAQERVEGYLQMMASDNQKGVPIAAAATPVMISSDGRTLLTIINASKKCEETDRGIECSYQVGDFFKVSIADIGTESSGIHFEKSNSDMPIYASFGMLHGCVIVNRFEGTRGIPEWVFISPKNGNVYNSWRECGKAS
jgi:hypothetical protein